MFLIFTYSCKKPDNTVSPSPSPDILKTYLHIGHPRTNENPFVIAEVKNIDYSKYDMLWLGGDLAYLTSNHDTVMKYIDSIFDLGNKNTLWAIGNHDYTNLEKIKEYTNRPLFYSYFKNGITFIVLDTQDSLSNIVGEQKTFFDNVVDTINQSSHLIILHHKLIWMYHHPDLESQISNVSNGKLGDCFYCINPNYFYQNIYPQLIEVKQRGIEVLCIAGDIGDKTKEFEYITNEGIYFIASGMYYDSITNKALVFNHNVTKKELNWEYKLVEDL